MENDPFTVFRIIAGLVFFGLVYAGYYMLANFDRFFGPDPEIPSENGSARGYRNLQVLVIWAHALLASGAFALFLH